MFFIFSVIVGLIAGCVPLRLRWVFLRNANSFILGGSLVAHLLCSAVIRSINLRDGC